MPDQTDNLLEAVATAIERMVPVRIAGNDTKSFMGRTSVGDPLNIAKHSGVIEYEPTELVITVRAGTTITEINKVLAGHGQRLGSEPPTFDGKATVGGTLACNLSGPARPWAGSLRDHVLGVRLINGRGEHLRFGGRVMKNVAGYDVSRLQAGAFGVLGLMTEITLRVQSAPEAEATRAFELEIDRAIEHMVSLASTCSPISAACWDGERLYVRYSGLNAAVEAATGNDGGDSVDDGDALWQSIREFRHPYFDGDVPLWRFSVPAAASLQAPEKNWMVDWGGAQRWLQSDDEPANVYRSAASLHGQASLFRGGNRDGDVLQPVAPVQQQVLKSLKYAFDPHGIFNPGRLFRWL